jgi:hypothetical protein
MPTTESAPPDKSQPAAETIREYKIVAGPFSGTYGEVRVGEHALLHNKRAFKKLHLHVQPEVIKQEALKQMSVRSPYVAQIYDYYDEQGGIIAMGDFRGHNKRFLTPVRS